MLRKVLVILAIITLLSTTVYTSKIDNSKENIMYTKRVLVLFSYNYTFPTVKDIIGGIEKRFSNSKIQYSIEFMDSKRIYNEEYISNLKRGFELKKEQGITYDIVIAFDDNGLKFAVDNKETLFDNVPIVFGGINDFQYAMSFNKVPDITGFVEEVSIKETIDIAMKINNSANKILAIVDNTTTSKSIEENINTIQKDYTDIEFEMINISNMYINNVNKYLKSINENKTIVILISAYNDKNGILNFEQAVKTITNSLPYPVYHLWKHGIGKGLFGGKVIDFYGEGYKVASLVVDILNNNVNIEDIKVTNSMLNKYCFDYELIRKFNIDKSILPEESEYINKPDYSEIIIIITILIMTIVLIKMFQTLIKERNKAEEANKAKGDFLAKISHELRTPLNAIVGYIRLINSNEIDDSILKKRIDVIEKSSNVLLSLINDILDISVIEHGKMKYYEEVVDIRGAIDNVIEIMEVTLVNTNVYIETIIDKNIPDYIIVDYKRLTQVLTNLLYNAIKYTDEGKITLSAQVKEVSNNEVNILWVVQDTGKGMKNQTIDKIFGAFEQEDNGKTRKYTGAGLGLFITKEIITRMGGNISVESQLNIGSKFTFNTKCQIATKEEKQSTIKISNYIEKTNKRILLVEDNEINQMLTKELLEPYVDSIVICENGEEAIQITNNSNFDIIFMDLHMPKMDGIKATTIIRENKRYEKVPIIALTADIINLQNNKSLKDLFDGYITKPIDMMELINVLKHK